MSSCNLVYGIKTFEINLNLIHFTPTDEVDE